MRTGNAGAEMNRVSSLPVRNSGRRMFMLARLTGWQQTEAQPLISALPRGHRFAIKTGLSNPATASRTHNLFLLFHFQFSNAHLIALRDLQRGTAAVRAGFMVRGHRKSTMAFLAYRLSRNADNLQFSLPGNTVLRYHSKEETQRFLFDASQLPDFQPNRFDTVKLLGLRGVLDLLQDIFGER